MVEVEELPSDYEEEEGETVIRQRRGQAEAEAEAKASAGLRTEDLSAGRGDLMKRVLVEGDGPVCGINKRVTVHYTGRFLDGRVFDSSVSRGSPFVFDVGRGSVIQGWEVGIASMKKGEKVILTCRPNYAYGAMGAGGVIPPNATLEFEVELLDFEEATGGATQYVVFFLAAAFVLYYYVSSFSKDLKRH